MQIMELRVKLGQKASVKETKLGLIVPYAQKIFFKKKMRLDLALQG
jgi:hypothetical protein